MAVPQANIIQAEFFLVGGDDTLPEEFIDKLKERLKDSSPIKVVVRFFDEGGSLTKAVVEAGKLRKRDADLRRSLRSTSRLRQRFLNNQSRELGNEIFLSKKEIRRIAIKCVHEAVQTSRKIATECPDHSFRYTKKDEEHELMEVVRASMGIWVFVFRPEDLLSETNTLIASVM